MAPTDFPQTQAFEQLFALIGEDISHDVSVLRDRSTPQYQALEWMANSDPSTYTFESVPKAVLIERFVAVLVSQLVADEESCAYRLDAFGSRSICDWKDFTGEFVSGILCAGGSVVRMYLGK